MSTVLGMSPSTIVGLIHRGVVITGEKEKLTFTLPHKIYQRNDMSLMEQYCPVNVMVK